MSRQGEAWLALAVLLAGLGVWLVQQRSSTTQKTSSEAAEPLRDETLVDATIRSWDVEKPEDDKVPDPSMERSERKPVASHELTWEQFCDFHEESLPGDIDGVVLRGLVPIADAQVRIWRGTVDQSWEEVLEKPSMAWTRTSGEDGRYGVGEVGTGRFLIRVDLASGETQESKVSIPGIGSERVHVHCFGWSLVEGKVSDGQGNPVAGALLVLSGTPEVFRWNSRLGIKKQVARFRADDRGNYRMPGILAGAWEIEAFTDGQVTEGGGTWCRFQLGPKETRQLDLGCPRGSGRWCGAIVDESGRRAAADFGVRLTDESSRVEWDFRTSEDGSFDVSVARGEYRIAVSLLSHEWPLSEPLLMPADDLQRDLVVPGATLDVRLMEEGEVFSRMSPRLRVRSGLLMPDLGRDSDGRFSWIGLKPGDYTLEVPGLRDFAIGDPQEFPIVIPENQKAIAIDVPVKAR